MNASHVGELLFGSKRKNATVKNGTKYELLNPQPSSRVRGWLISILIFLLTSLIVINTFTIGQFQSNRINSAVENFELKIPPDIEETTSSDYLVENKGCHIPLLDPFDATAKRYISKPKPLDCKYQGNSLPLIKSNDTAIYVNEEALYQYYNVTEKVDCCWRAFWRKNSGDDNAVTFSEECTTFEKSTSINVEFVKVECKNATNGIVYRDYHAFPQRKEKVEERCRTRNSMDNKNRLSILVVGLDSISRLNFHRTMPNSAKVLKSMGAVEMLGYTKVGDNTYPNLVPVLSGRTEEELRKLCVPDKGSFFDDCPFIWKNFSENGYRTIFAEDACHITTFNYLKPGFKSQPTDYYYRPYCVAMEGDIGTNYELNSYLCMGARKTSDLLLDYTRKIASTFSNDRYFAFFWQASMTHDFIEYPMYIDDYYAKFLNETANNRSLLKNTALIVMSDHGMRFGSYRQTYQGKMEDSLPTVFFVLPKWWRDSHSLAYKNLLSNAHRLTTPFDLHETLQDILHPESLTKSMVGKRSDQLANSKPTPRGVSMFLPINKNRDCPMAAIPDHWCMCHKMQNVSLNDPTVQGVVEFFVAELNRMVIGYPKCAKLTLHRLIDVKMWSEGEKKDKDKTPPFVDYTLTVQTKPGGGIFEGSVQHNIDGSGNKLTGSISRLNSYGAQSACVNDAKTRLYCYCI